MFIATALGYGIVLPDAAVHSVYARQFSQACKWSAITSLTISAPVSLLASCMHCSTIMCDVQYLKGHMAVKVTISLVMAAPHHSLRQLDGGYLLLLPLQVIGKVAQTGAERILGTFVGGSLGFLTYIVGRTFWTPDTRSDGVSPSCTPPSGLMQHLLLTPIQQGL